MLGQSAVLKTSFPFSALLSKLGSEVNAPTGHWWEDQVARVRTGTCLQLLPLKKLSLLIHHAHDHRLLGCYFVLV